ncbi:hypothetical protein ACLESD_39860 [Pyxidicoccus sp. 3LFB2]
MKPIRHVLLLALAVPTAAFAFDPIDEGSRWLMATPCAGSLSTAPAGVAPEPTPIASLAPSGALYPATSQLLSAYTFVVTDPADTDAFLAFGFDLRSQCLVFYVSGKKSRGDLDLLNARIAEDLRVIAQDPGTDPDFASLSSGQVGGPLIPRPGV